MGVRVDGHVRHCPFSLLCSALFVLRPSSPVWEQRHNNSEIHQVVEFLSQFIGEIQFFIRKVQFVRPRFRSTDR